MLSGIYDQLLGRRGVEHSHPRAPLREEEMFLDATNACDFHLSGGGAPVEESFELLVGRFFELHGPAALEPHEAFLAIQVLDLHLRDRRREKRVEHFGFQFAELELNRVRRRLEDHGLGRSLHLTFNFNRRGEHPNSTIAELLKLLFLVQEEVLLLPDGNSPDPEGVTRPGDVSSDPVPLTARTQGERDGEATSEPNTDVVVPSSSLGRSLELGDVNFMSHRARDGVSEVKRPCVEIVQLEHSEILPAEIAEKENKP